MGRLSTPRSRSHARIFAAFQPSDGPIQRLTVWAADGVLFAQTGEGLDTLRAAIVEHAQRAMGEGAFTARTRHVEALVRAQQDLRNAIAECGSGHIDLCADDLRRCHDALGEITGRVTPDDLLGAVFSTFCIGK